MADKYYRLVSFLVNVCPKPLRELFLKYMRADPTRAATCSTVDAYLKSRKPQLLILKQRKVIRKDQWELLFPSTHGQFANESSWDTTLVTLLIDELFRYQLQPIEEDAIQKIRVIRNRLQHIAETSIDDADFDNMWTILESATVDLAQQIHPSPLYANSIQEYIDDSKINNMPKLGDTLRYFYETIIMKLRADMEDMKEILKEVSESTSNNGVVTEECRNILRNTTVKTVGPAGVKVKRMKTVDHILTGLNNNFTTTMREGLTNNYDSPQEVSDIKTKLRDGHYVVVTGCKGSRYLDAALAAVKDMDYNHNRCVELRNSSDWRHIDPEEVDLVLCREPFGDYAFDEEKTKGMADIFINMLQTATNSAKSVDIVIVTESEILQQVNNFREHELLDEVVKLYQPTTESEPADLTGQCDNCDSEFDQATRNQLEFSAAYCKRYTDPNLHSKEVVDEAKATLKRSKVVVLTGPRQCGKTTLAVALTSKYQTNQFLVVNKPDDMKLIKIGSISTVLVEDFAGKYRYDDVQTQAWLKEFELLYSVVCSGKLSVIITCEQKSLQRCKEKYDSHPILQNPVVLKYTKRIVKKELIENKQKDTLLFTKVKGIHTHDVDLPENFHSFYAPQPFCRHPDGSFLALFLEEEINDTNESISPSIRIKLVVQHISSDFEHKCNYDTDLDFDYTYCDICCTDTGDVVITHEHDVRLYRLSSGTLHLIKSTELDINDISVSFNRNRIYSFNNFNISILDLHLNIKRKETLDLYSFFEYHDEDEDVECVPCSQHLFFSLDSYRKCVVCEDTRLKKIKCLIKENFHPVLICAATEDSVLVLGKQDNEHIQIIQLNSDMTILTDKSIEVSIEIYTWRSKMVYDRDKGRLVICDRHGIDKTYFIVIDLT